LAAVDSGPNRERVWLEAVGMRLLLARTARRESQRVVAGRAGVSAVTLGAVERGEHPGSLITYARLAAALGVSLGDLLAGYEAPAGDQRYRGAR
jgi:transcriptional regulator with XRE-family HTH domain